MFKRATVSSRAFIKKSTQQIHNDKKEIIYNVSSINVLEDSFMSQARMNMTQSQPLWSIAWTQPFQTSQTNRPIGVVSLLGPLSQYSTLPSRIAKNWKINKTIQKSLIHYGSYVYKNKQIKDDKNESILIYRKKLNFCTNKTFDTFDSLIRTQSALIFSEIWKNERSLPKKLYLLTKNVIFKARILSKKMALKTSQSYENKNSCQSRLKVSPPYEKTYPEIHIDLSSLSIKKENNFQNNKKSKEHLLSIKGNFKKFK